uniref:hypothetical protein n=1 Tax=Candidatus Magnetominusculus dajiuhuensis TaxID=3137712 RepID=UPI003B42AA0C
MTDNTGQVKKRSNILLRFSCDIPLPSPQYSTVISVSFATTLITRGLRHKNGVGKGRLVLPLFYDVDPNAAAILGEGKMIVRMRVYRE